MTKVEKVFGLILVCFLLSAGLSYADVRVKIAPLTDGIKSSNITVAGNATALPATALAGRNSIAIYNLNTSVAILYIGNSTVNTTTGFPLTSANPAISLDIDDTVAIYGITNGTSISVRTLEAK